MVVAEFHADPVDPFVKEILDKLIGEPLIATYGLPGGHTRIVFRDPAVEKLHVKLLKYLHCESAGLPWLTRFRSLEPLDHLKLRLVSDSAKHSE